MRLVIVPAETGEKLQREDEPVEVCTPDGRRIGFFTPGPVRQYNLDPGISREELERRYAEGGGRTWAEIRADWEKRA
jgi:hypothetical protein